jgi:hypothetical protein
VLVAEVAEVSVSWPADAVWGVSPTPVQPRARTSVERDRGRMPR